MLTGPISKNLFKRFFWFKSRSYDEKIKLSLYVIKRKKKKTKQIRSGFLMGQKMLVSAQMNYLAQTCQMSVKFGLGCVGGFDTVYVCPFGGVQNTKNEKDTGSKMK